MIKIDVSWVTEIFLFNIYCWFFIFVYLSLSVWRKKDWIHQMIPGVGPSGIVGIIWADDMKMIKDKLKDGGL